MPALFTMMSNRPNLVTAASMSFFRSLSLLTSASTPTDWLPSLATCCSDASNSVLATFRGDPSVRDSSTSASSRFAIRSAASSSSRSIGSLTSSARSRVTKSLMESTSTKPHAPQTDLAVGRLANLRIWGRACCPEPSSPFSSGADFAGCHQSSMRCLRNAPAMALKS
jgi:hypothetical protein